LSDCSEIQRIKMGFLRYLILKFLLLKKICSLSRQPSTLPASWPRVGRGELAPSHLLASPPPSVPGSSRVTALWPPAARGFSPVWPPHAPPPPKPAATAPAASAAPGPHHPATPRRLPTLWWSHRPPQLLWWVNFIWVQTILLSQPESVSLVKGWTRCGSCLDIYMLGAWWQNFILINTFNLFLTQLFLGADLVPAFSQVLH